MSTTWATIALLAAATIAIKAAGPVVLGGRELPSRATNVIALLAPALLAALVVTETFTTSERELGVDARAAGMAAAALALALRASMLVTLFVAAGAAAAVRLVA
jgi:uncharacterized membrane protein